MAYSYPGQNNVYIPSHEATNNLIVGFSRAPSTFAINRWCQIIPVTHEVGRFMRIAPENAGRRTLLSGEDQFWADGHARPTNHTDMEKFEFDAYQTRRYNFGFNIGGITQEQASWDIIQSETEDHAQQAMTLRTILATAVATDVTNYVSQNTDTVANILGTAGAGLNQATVANVYIKRTLNHMANRVHLNTWGVVKPQQMRIVMNPNSAQRLAETQEVHSYIKESRFSEPELIGGRMTTNNWGLPASLYGFEIVIEDAVYNDTRKTAGGQVNTNMQYVWPDNVLGFFSRIGGVTGKLGKNFSSVACFMKTEMKVGTCYESWNERTLVAVTENYGFEMISERSSFLATSAFV